MREYYISFYFNQGGATGFGGTVMRIEDMDCAEVIDKVSTKIKNYFKYDSVIICNWKAL